MEAGVPAGVGAEGVAAGAAGEFIFSGKAVCQSIQQQDLDREQRNGKATSITSEQE